jgi:A/G-specific adenine glycosylase
LIYLKLKVLANTAAAIASFPISGSCCDGNVFQVLSRYFDVETDIAQASAKGIRCFGFRSHAKDNPAISISMEFGALQCVPKVPLQYLCLTKVALLCKKTSRSVACKVQKLKVRNRYFNYLVLEDETGNTIVQKRNG